MSERPCPHVPFEAIRVLKATPSLSWGAKLVLLEQYGLEPKPDHKNTWRGCYAPAAIIGERLGTSARNIEAYRAEAKKAGVLKASRRQQEVGWYVNIPREFWPTSSRPDSDEIQTLALRLDAWMDGERRNSTPQDSAELERGSIPQDSAEFKKSNPARSGGQPRRISYSNPAGSCGVLVREVGGEVGVEVGDPSHLPRVGGSTNSGNSNCEKVPTGGVKEEQTQPGGNGRRLSVVPDGYHLDPGCPNHLVDDKTGRLLSEEDSRRMMQEVA